MKLSERDTKLLIVLVGVLLLGMSYLFGYSKFNAKKDTIESEIQTLEDRYNKLSVMDARRAEYVNEVDEFDKSIQKIEEKYPSAVTTENEMVFITKLREYCGATIPATSYVEDEVFYTPMDMVSGADSQDTSTEEAKEEDTSAEASNENDTSGEQKAEENKEVASGIVGHRAVTTLSFVVGNLGLKKMIKYINEWPLRKTVDNFTVSYDGTTGMLTGTLSYNSYFITGANCVFEPLEMPTTSLGVNNIFGTKIEQKTE